MVRSLVLVVSRIGIFARLHTLAWYRVRNLEVTARREHHFSIVERITDGENLARYAIRSHPLSLERCDLAEDGLRVDLASAYGPIGCTERDRWHSEKPAVLLCAQFAVCCHTLGRIVLGIASGGSDGGNDALPSWRVGASLRGQPPDDRLLHD